ncbi:MAG: tRNA (adenosine(37)-N6)-dimethylallyltransferase MiaA [Chitinivibrionales bacterium]|nr:tRNA (adenosine(37)-N6)-dimethylallyltransferase MiaA [Chitinivibrionales bacterium]MBD3394721.1 tRNA (adenosine(37)-N6)-dimethylallyltransferase MiaA [Chitinivibrionales bacterium]
MSEPIHVPVILGPTGVGKTGLALELAGRFGMEIVSCDSRQVYRGMDIGTAKPTPAQQARARHWLIDILEPSESYSAFRYARDAREVIVRRAAAGVPVALCGGTGLYFRSLSRGLTTMVASNPELRKRLERRAEAEGPGILHEELARVDPASARRLHPNDRQRIVRALQVFYDSGIPLSAHVDGPEGPVDMHFAIIILSRPREDLYARINRRVRHMIELGLWREHKALIDKGFGREDPGMRCVGYRELFDVAEGKTSLETAIGRIQQNTRRYAKRQKTWFAHQCDGHVLDMAGSNVLSRAAELVGRHLGA